MFSVVGGRLEARHPDLPKERPSSVFERIGDDVYRTTQGRERGELLRVTRDDAGVPVKLNWATYLCTREPLAFGEETRLTRHLSRPVQAWTDPPTRH